MMEILDHLESLGYSKEPDYKMIQRVFSNICDRHNYSSKDPFDWESGGEYHETFKEVCFNTVHSPSTASLASGIFENI
jgi:hypothetical protein